MFMEYLPGVSAPARKNPGTPSCVSAPSQYNVFFWRIPPQKCWPPATSKSNQGMQFIVMLSQQARLMLPFHLATLHLCVSNQAPCKISLRATCGKTIKGEELFASISSGRASHSPLSSAAVWVVWSDIPEQGWPSWQRSNSAPLFQYGQKGSLCCWNS